MTLSIAGLALYAGFEAFRIWPLFRSTQQLIAEAKPYLRTAVTQPMLVLGNSTAVVGAQRPEKSVIGLIAAPFADASVENYAASGARIDDLPRQFSKAVRQRYDLVLVQIGANDLIRFRSAAEAAANLFPMLVRLKNSAERVILVMAGNVGGAPFFPWAVRPYYRRQSLAYHAALADSAQRAGVIYINLYLPPATDPFVLQPAVYLAADQVHPSSAGYAL